jgi:serine/threonine-protein kinase HipA
MSNKIFVDLARGVNNIHVGTLHVNNVRGGTVVAFAYSSEWLDAQYRFQIDPYLPLCAGQHYVPNNAPLFGCFTDAAPDRWGRTLMQRREIKKAAVEKRTPKTLTDIDFLLGVNDDLRMGAFRFRDGDAYLAPQTTGSPHLIHIQKFYKTLTDLQNGERWDAIDDADIQEVLAPGSSLGGSRPKATLYDATGKLFLIKFPQDSDSVDMPLWEKVSLDLAARCGICTPGSILKKLPDGRHCLILERFDRDGRGRIHFASAMTLLGARDNDGILYSYLDIAAILQKEGGETAVNLNELWKRMAFNVLTSNRDDHLRNHGFLRDNAGWRLSPVYDLESDCAKTVHRLALDENNTEPDIQTVLNVSPYFDMPVSEAKDTVTMMEDVLQEWGRLAKQFGANRFDIDLMAKNYLLDESLETELSNTP